MSLNFFELLKRLKKNQRNVKIIFKKNRVLVISHELLLSILIESFFYGSTNKHYLNAIEEYTTSAIFNVSFKCKEWFEINKSVSKINFYKKPKDL